MIDVNHAYLTCTLSLSGLWAVNKGSAKRSFQILFLSRGIFSNTTQRPAPAGPNWSFCDWWNNSHLRMCIKRDYLVNQYNITLVPSERAIQQKLALSVYVCGCRSVCRTHHILWSEPSGHWTTHPTASTLHKSKSVTIKASTSNYRPESYMVFKPIVAHKSPGEPLGRCSVWFNEYRRPSTLTEFVST